MRRDGTIRAQVIRVAGLGVVFAAAFVVIYVFTVRTLPGRAISDASLRGALLTNGLLSRVVSPVLNVVSVASLLGAMAVVALVALARSARLLGMVAVGVVVAANVSALVLKRVLLSRPEFGLKEVAPSTLNSLPSGHSTAALSAVVALLLVVPARLRWPTAAVGGAYASFTGVATMSAGWHRAGDSLAAYVLVGFWAATAGVVLLLGPDDRKTVGGSPGRSRLARWWGAGSVGLVGLGGAIALLLAVIDPLRDSVLGPPTAFMAGGLLIFGTAAAVLFGVLWIRQVCDGAARAPLSGVASQVAPEEWTRSTDARAPGDHTSRQVNCSERRDEASAGAVRAAGPERGSRLRH